ncbi:MAG: hypothetical protein JWO82_3475 [Akkermansiaceae bacterium]|nr:hypothetical protein [Akkermansiaceae bacterium]
MSKALLIGILIAVLLGIAGLVWWQSAGYDKRERNLKRQLDEENQLRQKNKPFVPQKTSDNTSPHPSASGLMGVYL